MNNQPYKAIRFDWLANPSKLDATVLPDQGDTETTTYPLPRGFGTCSIETLNLSLGMSVFRATNRLTPDAVGQSISTAEIFVELKEPTFQAQTIRGGRVIERHVFPPGDLTLSPGVDLFRYSDGYRMVPMLDGSSDSEMTCLSVGRSMLGQLVGEDETELLLTHLKLNPMPKVTAHAISLHISEHLHSSISPKLTGASKKLHCQARVLDYLSALIQNFTKDTNTNPRKAKQRSNEVRDLLLQTEGKLPTLNELAAQFGCSARTLNDEFSAVFGVSIYSFITTQRLTTAHAAIQRSDIPLKALAFQLGYSHVNHFITAFRKKFGYSPGSLRN